MRSTALAALALTLVIGVVGVGAVQAAPPTNDPTTAAAYGARWLAAEFDPAGFIPNASNDPNVGRTLQDTLALAAAGVEGPTFDQAMTWIEANAASIIVGGDPGRIGYLLLLADAAQVDPTDFGGIDLPAELLDTLGAREPGLFGDGDPTYDGVFRQSLAITGLSAANVATPASAVAWLADQQCDAANPAADGGWQAYRSDLAQPCDAPDADNYTGPDTNATALALQALESIAPFAGTDAALDFLATNQGADGGFPYVSGGSVDPNSTALVIQAIVAAGEDPTTGRWAQSSPDPVTSLLSWQVGCDAAEADRGGFASPFSAGLPDPGATGQAVWGASGRAFPLGPVTFSSAPVPCEVPPPSSTTTTAPATPTTTATSNPVRPAVTRPAAAQPVTAQPQLAG